MGNFTNLRLRIIDFWKKHKKKIAIILILYFMILVVNYSIKNMPEKIPEPSFTYKPHVSVINEKEVPQKYQQPIENLVDKYFNYCNNMEYENAYNLISDECKKAYYPKLEDFKTYVDYVFRGKKKTYTLQSYSVVDNVYIYDIKIMDDFMANGTSDGYYYYQEKLTLKEENGNMKLSIGNFVSQDNPNIMVEDEYMKVEITNRLLSYNSETYTIKVTNKTDDKYIVLADGKQYNELQLDIGSRKDNPEEAIDSFIIAPGTFRVKEVTFTKFYDNEIKSIGLYFGAVRIFKSYTPSVGTTQENLDNAVKLYSIEIPLD